jgi:alcohol dehydrogenase, propanol-preferring
MGLRVAAVDVSTEKLAHAERLGAEVMIDAREGDPGTALKEKTSGGAHGAIVTAVSARAFEQSVTMLRPAGTVSFIGLPGGDADQIRLSISGIVNTEISVRGSNVGTRQDLNEAIAFAANGLVKADIETQPLENINAIFARMKKGEITGRVVLAID